MRNSIKQCRFARSRATQTRDRSAPGSACPQAPRNRTEGFTHMAKTSPVLHSHSTPFKIHFFFVATSSTLSCATFFRRGFGIHLGSAYTPLTSPAHMNRKVRGTTHDAAPLVGIPTHRFSTPRLKGSGGGRFSNALLWSLTPPFSLDIAFTSTAASFSPLTGV